MSTKTKRRPQRPKTARQEKAVKKALSFLEAQMPRMK